MSAAETILDRNREYAPTHDRSQIADRPRLMTMIVTCVDARVDPAHFAGIELGDALTIRALGGRVTDAVAQQVAAFSELVRGKMGAPMPEVVVIHHTECGTAAFADPEFAQQVADGTSTPAQTWADIAVTDAYATVQADVEKLRGTPGIDESTVITGFVYDIETGKLEQP